MDLDKIKINVVASNLRKDTHNFDEELDELDEDELTKHHDDIDWADAVIDEFDDEETDSLGKCPHCKKSITHVNLEKFAEEQGIELNIGDVFVHDVPECGESLIIMDYDTLWFELYEWK